jgi:hypothetical protein
LRLQRKFAAASFQAIAIKNHHIHAHVRRVDILIPKRLRVYRAKRTHTNIFNEILIRGKSFFARAFVCGVFENIFTSKLLMLRNIRYHAMIADTIMTALSRINQYGILKANRI